MEHILLISETGNVIQFESIEAVANHLGTKAEVARRHLATERSFRFKKVKHVLMYKSEVEGLFITEGVQNN